jgi:DNA primase
MIPDEVIEQVRDAADLVQVIGETVELKRSGSDWRGPCPFHGGVHRNFAVIPKKGRYYCFVCKESGDIFSWYMKRMGLSYPDAVREVARAHGIQIPESNQRQGPDPREPLFSAASVAHDWFAAQFRDSPEAETARRYVAERGFDLETLEPLQLGYAPRSPDAFQKAMAQLGVREEVLLEAGILARRDDGRVVPRFRGRLLFPIHDLRGRVVGFGGRLLGPGEPKYLNSPESPIFKKGQTLYNLHAARNAIRKEGLVVVVEGYFDVLRLVVAGLEHVVAPLGTALTGDQAALLKRYTNQAVLLLDSDLAGLKATFRAGDELLRHELRVRVATMPAGEDPDTLVAKGGLKALEPILADAIDVMERKVQILDRRGWFTDVEHRREALDRLLPTIRATRDPIQRELYLDLVAKRTGVDKKVLEQEVASLKEPVASAPRPAPSGEGQARRAADPPARHDGAPAELALLRLMVASPEWRTRVAEGVPAEWFEGPGHREMFARLSAVKSDGPAPLPEGLDPAIAARWARFLAEAPQALAGPQDRIFDGACRVLEARPHFRALDQLNRRIAAAPSAEHAALWAEKRELVANLRARYPDEYERRYGWRRPRRRPERR